MEPDTGDYLSRHDSFDDEAMMKCQMWHLTTLYSCPTNGVADAVDHPPDDFAQRHRSEVCSRLLWLETVLRIVRQCDTLHRDIVTISLFPQTRGWIFDTKPIRQRSRDSQESVIFPAATFLGEKIAWRMATLNLPFDIDTDITNAIVRTCGLSSASKDASHYFALFRISNPGYRLVSRYLVASRPNVTPSDWKRALASCLEVVKLSCVLCDYAWKL